MTSRSAVVLAIVASLWLIVPLVVFSQGNSPDRIQLQLNTSEAEAVLALADKHAAGQPTVDADWHRLFITEPYIRLQKREASMHRDFTNDDFRRFVLSDDLVKRAPDLRHTLEEWKKADLAAAARRILPYLPDSARIRTKVFPMVKPKTNSFVFDVQSDPAIFLYLDPAVSPAQFENTVAHEMHHIGFASIESETEAFLKDLPPNVKPAAEWMGAFGEGFAMLAAAGGPDIHPQATRSDKDRARWDHDMANYNQDLKTLEQFFLDIINGKFKTKDDIDEKAFSFFGTQGPWYTVGYKMAVTIEKQYGRATLLDCMINIRKLLPTYNRAAAEQNDKNGGQLALWSPELIKAIAPR